MKLSIKLILLFIILVYGCKKSTKIIPKSEKNVKIPISKPEDDALSLKFSNVIDTTKFIKLETKPDCVIGAINKIIIYNDHIFIMDSRRSMAVFEFDTKGNFIRQYGKKGKGPGEYIKLTAFGINKKEQKIILYDWAKKRLLSYNTNGEFIEGKKINVYLNDFVFHNDSYIVDIHNRKKNASDNSRKFSLAFLPKNEEMVTEFLEAQYKIKGYGSYNNLVTDGSNVYFKEPFSNKIFKINSNNSAVSFLSFEFEKNQIPISLFDKNLNFKEFKNILENNSYSFISEYQMFSDKIIFTVKTGKEFSKFLYSTKTEKMYSLNNLKNDTSSIGFLNLTGSFGTNIIGYLPADVFLDFTNSPRGKSETLTEIANKTIINDNPILVIHQINSNL